MEDQREEKAVQEVPFKSSKVSQILKKGWRLGKKIAITGVAVSSVPFVLPPLVVFSALGIVCSVPFGLLLASYACTEKAMSKLLSSPVSPHPLLECHAFPADEGGDCRQRVNMEEEEEIMEGTKTKVEMRINLDEDKNGVRDESIGFAENENKKSRGGFRGGEEEESPQDMDGHVKGEEEESMQEESKGNENSGDIIKEDGTQLQATGITIGAMIDENYTARIVETKVTIEIREEKENQGNLVEGEEFPLDVNEGTKQVVEENGGGREAEETPVWVQQGEVTNEENTRFVIQEEGTAQEIWRRIGEIGKDGDYTNGDLVMENEPLIETKSTIEIRGSEENEGNLVLVEEIPFDVNGRGKQHIEENEEIIVRIAQKENRVEENAEIMVSVTQKESRVKENEEIMVRTTQKECKDGEIVDEIIEEEDIPLQEIRTIVGEGGDEEITLRVAQEASKDEENAGDTIEEEITPLQGIERTIGAKYGEDYTISNIVMGNEALIEIKGTIGTRGDEENEGNLAEKEGIPLLVNKGVKKGVEENLDRLGVGIEKSSTEIKGSVELRDEEKAEEEDSPEMDTIGVKKGTRAVFVSIEKEEKLLTGVKVIEEEHRNENVDENVQEEMPTEEINGIVKEIDQENQELSAEELIGMMGRRKDEKNVHYVQEEKVKAVKYVGEMEKERRDEAIADGMVDKEKKPTTETKVLMQEKNSEENVDIEDRVHVKKMKEKSPSDEEYAREVADERGFDVLDGDDSFSKKVPSNEVLCNEEKIWKQIYAIRKIVGYKEPLYPSCTEELKALYVFTGVEPPASFKESSDLVEVNDKLQFLMSIVGVK
ncbi:PREDICTED: uncharacterized protein LOC104590675 isoform X2 [Nelumbo nucifera]|uniref:Uncharacterized protein LOC104590675 isoform X2 n=1 Tax=Nelumbo nucifera TaxID=4432 RepID=A0A1U8PZZ0_NELNU|nr:PREDICTED: uncharacterized protein LOC104590675 isoform X2 [Nelumbo nucifera]